MKFTILNTSSKGVNNMSGVEILNTTIHYKIDYVEHEVLINDSVSFTELNEKYEIVSQKCKIYVVREKEND